MRKNQVPADRIGRSRLTWALMPGLLLLSLLLFLGTPLGLAKTIVRSPITEFEKQKVDAFVAGQNLLERSNFTAQELDSIGPVEHLIFRKAILLGGLDADFEDLIVPNSARAREAVRSGSAVGSGTAQWHDYYEGNRAEVFESDAVGPLGGYEKGLYATRDKSETLKIARLDELRAVSSETWNIDWRTLEALPLKALYSASNRLAQFRMVQAGRADFTLQDFSALPDLSIEEGRVRLYPIHGVKIALRGTRHFWVSKRHPDGAKVFAALQKGLRILRANGEIEKMMRQSGNINSSTRDWTVLNPR